MPPYAFLHIVCVYVCVCDGAQEVLVSILWTYTREGLWSIMGLAQSSGARPALVSVLRQLP